MEDLTKQIEALVQAKVIEQVSTMVDDKLNTIARVVEAVRTGSTLSELDDEVRDLKADLALAKEAYEEEKAKVEKLTLEVEHHKEENRKLLDMVGDTPKTMNCDECGAEFEPIKKIVQVKRAYCADHAPDLIKAKANQKYEDYITDEKRSHKALDPEVKFSELATAVRSEAQQARRAREALAEEAVVYAKSSPAKRECLNCGKLTNKLYCTDDCRKEHEKSKHTEYMRQYRAKPEDAIKTAKCVECGNEFEKTKKIQKICSDACRQERQKKSVRRSMKNKYYGITPDEWIEQGPEEAEWRKTAYDTVNKLSQRPDARPLPGR